jgi:hypothetical protein
MGVQQIVGCIRQAASPPLNLKFNVVCPQKDNNNKVMNNYIMYDRM